LSDISRVFQRNVSLSEVLFIIIFLDSSGVLLNIQLLALANFGVPCDSFKSLWSGITVYIEVSLAVSPDVDVLSNPFVLWINVSMKITAPHSDTVRDALYIKIVKSSFIISIIPLMSCFSSFRMANTCLNNAMILPV